MPLFSDPIWQEQVKKHKADGRLKTIRKMQLMYGVKTGEKCGDCVNFLKVRPGQNSYFKCGKYTVTRGAATDWRVSWTAYGLFERREGEPKSK